MKIIVIALLSVFLIGCSAAYWNQVAENMRNNPYHPPQYQSPQQNNQPSMIDQYHQMQQQTYQNQYQQQQLQLQQQQMQLQQLQIQAQQRQQQQQIGQYLMQPLSQYHPLNVPNNVPEQSGRVTTHCTSASINGGGGMDCTSY
ncbi:MAG: hypothetical protein HQL26_02270 [Candidatus Omnitrophica bacterium]|nr:hypothetical protein [Candidatus Omnitrophota bacterium]